MAKKAGSRFLPLRCPALSLYAREKKWDDAGDDLKMRQGMNRYLLTALLVFVPLSGASPQAKLVNVKPRVLLVDKDLNQKPLRFHVVSCLDHAHLSTSTDLMTDP